MSTLPIKKPRSLLSLPGVPKCPGVIYMQDGMQRWPKDTGGYNFHWTISVQYARSAIPKLFGSRDWCAYENLMPDDMRGADGGDASIRERLQIQMELCLPTVHLLLCGLVLNRPQTSTGPQTRSWC